MVILLVSVAILIAVTTWTGVQVTQRVKEAL